MSSGQHNTVSRETRCPRATRWGGPTLEEVEFGGSRIVVKSVRTVYILLENRPEKKKAEC